MRLINRRIESALLLVHFYIKENQPRLIGGIDRSIHMRFPVDSKIKSRHTANAVLKQAGLKKAF